MQQGDISESNIEKVLRRTFNELLIDTNKPQIIEEIIDEFWILLKNEIISHNDLNRYLMITYSQEISRGVFGLNEKIESLLVEMKNIGQEINIDVHKDELIDYIIAMQQIFINEVESDFIERKFYFDEINTNLDISEILREKSNILILGEPGYGKTYSVKKMLFEITTTKEEEFINKIPVFLNLSVYGEKYSSIIDGIVQLFQNYINDIKQIHLSKYLKEGKLIIILDGLDEVKLEHYECCIDDIKVLMQHNPLNQFIITCRENVYFDELNRGVKEVRITPLSKSQIDACLKKYCDLRSYEITEDNYELFSNPLLLNIGVEVVNNNKGKIPNNRSIMFNKYMEYLLYKWERKKGLKRNNQLSYYDTIMFLSKISFILFDNPYLTTLKLQGLIKEEFPSKDLNLVYEQLINIGVLVYKSDDDISFAHKTFKEYFAAYYIVKNIEKKENYGIIDSLIEKKQWHEVFIFAAGIFSNWKLQNLFLNYILENNLKIYVDCINGKNDFNDYLLSLDIHEYSINYLDTLLTSYEKIIEKHFSQLKSKFYPYNTENEYIKDSKLCLIGQLSEDKKYLHYTFALEKGKGVRIQLLSPGEVRDVHKTTMNYQSHYVNLELSNLLGDSARTIAINGIKCELSKILKKRQLNENVVLICERIEDMKRDLPIKNIKEIDKIYDWVHTILQKANDRAEGKFVGYSYNGVELMDIHTFAEYLMQNKIDYQYYLLPGKDINLSGCGGWIWDFYTEQRLIERVRMFFYYYQLSFIYLIENNFNKLKEYLPDYRNLPYKYIIEIEFKKNSAKDYLSQPLMTYYYIATDEAEDCTPEIKITQLRLGWNEHKEIIEKSFKSKHRFTNNYSVQNTGVTMTMQEGRTGRELPLLSHTYELIEKNLQKILGEF